MYSHLNFTKVVHSKSYNDIPREFDGSNIPFENILGNISCFSSSQPEGLTEDTEFMRKQLAQYSFASLFS
jgi:hypothetical protein